MQEGNRRNLKLWIISNPSFQGSRAVLDLSSVIKRIGEKACELTQTGVLKPLSEALITISVGGVAVYIRVVCECPRTLGGTLTAFL